MSTRSCVSGRWSCPTLVAVLTTWLAAGAAEEPGPATGLVLWLDAADANTVKAVDGQVGEWRDKSGGGRHLGQQAAAARPRLSTPTAGQPAALSFDGSTTFLQGPAVVPAGHAAYSVVAVWRPRQNTGVQSVFEQGVAPLAANTRAALLAVGPAYGFNGESNDCHSLVPFEADAWRLSVLVLRAGDERNVSLWDNGVLYRAGTPAPAALRLGDGGTTVGRKFATDGEYLNGEVAEIQVYDRALAPAEVTALMAGLDRKWGLDCLGGFRTADGRYLTCTFDEETYGEWQAEGTAFGSGPARGALPNQMGITGSVGAGFVTSYHGGDGSVGTLTSPPILLERKYIRFLIGGGKVPGEACLNLLVDGQVVRTATGPNDKPGGSERLEPDQWDVTDLVGKTAVLQVVDRATGGWGHINVDHIIAADHRLPPLVDQSREFQADRRYLNLPVRNGAPKRRLSLQIGGATEREFDIELADAEPDFWAFLDLTPFRGQTVTLRGVRIPEGSPGFAAIETADGLRGAEDLYREALRPQFHFTSRRGWNNDPNGLVYHAGEYHLFYQHNPYGVQWGNMHWGHAVSPDLVHWQELPIAVYPDVLGPAFSGSAVVDETNSAGFQTGPEKPIVCIYTAAGNPAVQCLAFSNDRGRTWSKYAGNPILPHIVGGNRDPKVIWYAPDRKWIMALYLDGDQYALFASPDLKAWERLCDVALPGTSECPEFFEIPVAGRPGETRWVFYGGNGRYLLGRFDGRTFTPESGPHPLNFGTCFYASQTFTGLPPADGRRILVAWGTVGLPGMPFNQMMDFPVELTLRPVGQDLRLFAVPAREIEKLHGRRHQWRDLAIGPGSTPLPGASGELLHIRAEFAAGAATRVGLRVRGIPVVCDVGAGELTCRDRRAPLPAPDGRVRLEVLVDRASVEIFGHDGQLYMPMGIIPAANQTTVEVISEGAPATAVSLEVWELSSAWATAPGKPY